MIEVLLWMSCTVSMQFNCSCRDAIYSDIWDIRMCWIAVKERPWTVRKITVLAKSPLIPEQWKKNFLTQECRLIDVDQLQCPWGQVYTAGTSSTMWSMSWMILGWYPAFTTHVPSSYTYIEVSITVVLRTWKSISKVNCSSGFHNRT